jgi:putative ABC transport system substrate-binding protein
MISTYAEVDSEPVSVAIVFSLAHQQYLEAVEGLSRVLEAESVDLEVFTLEDYHGKRRSVLKEKMTEPSFGFYVGVGRKAARFIWDELDFQKTKSLYSVVQDPEKILPLTKDACGISLNIPISTQVEKISAGLPGAKRIGLLFDPRNNDPFFIQAQKIAEDFGLRIVPLRVSSSEEIPAVLKTHLKDVDALWLITDSTGTPSESIIQFIIETALLNRVPVIGYNSFYHESGAALSFIFDYQELGVQTGELIMELLNTGVCSSPDPKFSLWVNRKTSQRLGIPLGEEAVTEDGATP